jgi:hypothetical protein
MDLMALAFGAAARRRDSHGLTIRQLVQLSDDRLLCCRACRSPTRAPRAAGIEELARNCGLPTRGRQMLTAKCRMWREHQGAYALSARVRKSPGDALATAAANAGSPLVRLEDQ